MLGRECSQESLCIEDFPWCRGASDLDISSEEASCRLNDDRSSYRIDIASCGDRPVLFIPPADLYFHQKLLCGTTSLVRRHRSRRRWTVQISERCKIHVRPNLRNPQVPRNENGFGQGEG